MFEKIFKNIDKILRMEAGCTTEIDYVEQISWILFLKYLDDIEVSRSTNAKFIKRPYVFIIDDDYRWTKWACPKDNNESFKYINALTGDDLIKFVNQKLFPYLQSFRKTASSPNTIEYKIGEIFSEIKNRFQNGYSLRKTLEFVNELRFQSQNEKYELSQLYEARIKKMGNAGRNGGEYYTPRPLIRAMIQVIRPKIGELIYDGALGSGGFLCEAYEYLIRSELNTDQIKTLQENTFFGKEKKILAYTIANMNMIINGISVPNIIHTNTLSEKSSFDYNNDCFDIILANPPFGGKERSEVQQNFSIKTAGTSFLFLQHFIDKLKNGGRAAIVIKNTFLSNSDAAACALRRRLLESCNLHTVLDCPRGTFLGAGVRTVVLFFDKGSSTHKIWYYQLDPGRNMGKTNALNDNDLKDFVELQKHFIITKKSWVVDIAKIDNITYDLSVKNPYKMNENSRNLRDILEEIANLDAESAIAIDNIRGML